MPTDDDDRLDQLRATGALTAEEYAMLRERSTPIGGAVPAPPIDAATMARFPSTPPPVWNAIARFDVVGRLEERTLQRVCELVESGWSPDDAVSTCFLGVRHVEATSRSVAPPAQRPFAPLTQPIAAPAPPVTSAPAPPAPAAHYPAGWHPMPDGQRERYWDGTQWTGSYRPLFSNSPGQPQPTFVVAAPYKGTAIASMVLGICSLVLCYVGLVTGIIGLILGATALKDCEPQGKLRGRGMAISGIVCSIIGLGFWLVIIVAVLGRTST